jgi:hypothetical protein
MRSSKGMPDAWYLLAIETTSRRFAHTNSSCASAPRRTVRRNTGRCAALDRRSSLSLHDAREPRRLHLLTQTNLIVSRQQHELPNIIEYERTKSASSRSLAEPVSP